MALDGAVDNRSSDYNPLMSGCRSGQAAGCEEFADHLFFRPQLFQMHRSVLDLLVHKRQDV